MWLYLHHHRQLLIFSSTILLKYQLSAPVNCDFAVGISLYHNSQRKTSQDLKMPICCEFTTFFYQWLRVSFGNVKIIFTNLQYLEVSRKSFKFTSFCHLHQSYEFSKRYYQCISKKNHTRFGPCFAFRQNVKTAVSLFQPGPGNLSMWVIFLVAWRSHQVSWTTVQN